MKFFNVLSASLFAVVYGAPLETRNNPSVSIILDGEDTLSYYFPTMGLTAGKSACKTRASSDHKTAYTVVSFDGACVIVHSESDCHGSYTGPYPDGSYSLGGNWPREARSFKLYPAVNGKC